MFGYGARSYGMARRRVVNEITLMMSAAERRFQRSLHNLFTLYVPLADRWTIQDNATGTLKRIAHGTGRRIYVEEPEEWRNLKQLTLQFP